MSKDITLSAIGKVSFEQYHEVVLSLIDPELRPFVQKEWTKGIYDDNTRKGYPIRTTKNEIASMAAQVRRAEESSTLTGWVLPGCDIPRIRGDATNIPGWRPNMLVTEKDGVKLNKPMLVGLTVWGQHVSLWADRNVAKDNQRRVSLPLFRPVSVMVQEKEFNTRNYGKKKGFDLLFIKAVHSQEAIHPGTLLTLLKTSENTFNIEELSEQQVFSSVVLTGINWMHAESIDEWVEDPEHFDRVPIMGQDGRQLTKPDPMTGRPELQFEMHPKRMKSITGQPFLQQKIGDDSENPIQIPTMKIMLGNVDEAVESSKRVRIELQNYRYGKPEIYIYGISNLMQSAITRGNFMDSDPTKNPYAVLNDAYRGTGLTVVANFTKWNKYDSQEGTTYYVTLIGGLVLYEDAGSLEGDDIIYPPFPEDIPLDIITGAQEAGAKAAAATVAPVTPPTPAIRGANVTKAPVEEKKEEEEEVSDLTREDVLYEMTVKEIQGVLRKYRKEGYEVSLRGNKATLIAQILTIEEGEAISAAVTMAAHEDQVAAEEATEEPKPDLTEAKAKLLQKKKSQTEATKELESPPGGISEDQMASLEERLKGMLEDVPNDEVTWDDLWGKKNDLGVFPEWVNTGHRDLVEIMIKRIQKTLQALKQKAG